MIKRLAPHPGRLDKDLEVFYQLRLAGKFLDGRRPDIILKLLIRRAQGILVRIEVDIWHIPKGNFFTFVSMNIGIIGSAEVGQALAKGFLSEGYSVMLGTRDPSKPELLEWKKENKGGLVGTFAEAAQFGEILVLATGGDVTESAIVLAGKQHFAGKVVIDATNPIAKKTSGQRRPFIFYQPRRLPVGKDPTPASGCQAGQGL